MLAHDSKERGTYLMFVTLSVQEIKKQGYGKTWSLFYFFNNKTL
jgi:hypothetical protein